SVVENGVAQVGFAQIGVAQIGFGEISANEIGAPETSAAKGGAISAGVAETVFIEFGAGAVIGCVAGSGQARVAGNERRFDQISIGAIADQAESFGGPTTRAGAEIAARGVGIRGNSPDYAAGKNQEYKAGRDGSA